MRKPRKMKLVGEVVEILKKEGKEISHASVSSWVMSQMRMNPINEARYGGLKQGDFAAYFREVHEQAA